MKSGNINKMKSGKTRQNQAKHNKMKQARKFYGLKTAATHNATV